MRCRLLIQSSLGLLFVWALFAVANAAQEIVITVPAGLEMTEGDLDTDEISVNPGGYRIQVAYDSDLFTQLPETHRQLVALRFRPDGSLTQPLSTNIEHWDFRLSTTQKGLDNLSLSFAENIGDDETVVYEGPVQVTTLNSGPVGGPKDFDILFNFQRPFYYDPSMGNLLQDTISTGLAEIVPVDEQAGGDTGSGWVYSFSPTSPMATHRGTNITVTQFVFVPEPASVFLCLTAFAVVMTFKRRGWFVNTARSQS